MKANVNVIQVSGVYRTTNPDYDRVTVLLESDAKGTTVAERATIICRHGELEQGVVNETMTVELRLGRQVQGSGYPPSLAIFLINRLRRQA